MPKLVDPANVYAADTPGNLTGAARTALPRIYVPNSQSDTVDVIDPSTFRIVDHFAVGGLPQHVVPAYDLKHLYVTNDTGNTLTVIDPQTGKPVRTIPVDDPYNMYFTPDGRYAIVVAERNARLDFRDAHTFALVKSISTPCRGVDHMDFTADGTKALVSCEFSGQLLELDVTGQRIVKVFGAGGGLGMPQDVKLSPDGRVFYVADMLSNGVWLVGARSFRVTSFIHTGRGAHGLYPSRDARYLYVSNRGEGSISVLSFATRKVVHTWRIPGGGSPDMGGVSADGKVLWLSGRYSGVVYAISTRDGKLLARIPVGLGPHGLCVWPQPGRYSLGHTGILRQEPRTPAGARSAHRAGRRRPGARRRGRSRGRRRGSPPRGAGRSRGSPPCRPRRRRRASGPAATRAGPARATAPRAPRARFAARARAAAGAAPRRDGRARPRTPG